MCANTYKIAGLHDARTNVAMAQDTAGADNAEYAWTYENGRRYPSSKLGHYYMPNDEPEIQRLNQQHWVFTQVKGGTLHFAPFPAADELNILDIGCGSGIWCVQMAEDYPCASIVGIDVSPIQPRQKPDNVTWRVMDMEADWPYPEEHFQLIHLSLVHGCVKDWARLLSKIMRHLVPGGHVEHHELSFAGQYLVDERGQRIPMPSRTDDLPPFLRWTQLMDRAAEQRGRTIQLGPRLVSMQARAGFQGVTEQIFPHKWGGWPSDAREHALGTRTMEQILAGIDGFTTVMFTKFLGWSLEETRAFLHEVKRDICDDSLRKVVDLHVVYGQKPAQRSVAEPNEGSSAAAALVESPGCS